MNGVIVPANQFDSIRIEVLGEGRAITIPASYILAVDSVLRKTLVDEEGFDIDAVESEAGQQFWEARSGNRIGHGSTPWGAVIALADKA